MSETADKKPRLLSAAGSNLPSVAVISDNETFRRAVKLLKEGILVKAKQSELEERAAEIRDELAAISEAYQLKGMKYGLAGFEYHGYVTRKSLSKERLLALGVPADTIDQAFVEGNPYLSTKLIVFDLE